MNMCIRVISIIWVFTWPVPVFSAEAPDDAQVATGFFISDAGLLITAEHAIRNASTARVVIDGRRIIEAEVIKTDPQSDLALLKVNAITPFLYLSHSNGVPAGMDVVTIGYPQIRILGITPKITRGIVNSGAGMKDDLDSFQFSAEVQKGNSGGPLIGPGGMVVGVVRSKLDALKLSQQTSDLPQNVNFATKSSKLIQFVQGIPGIPQTRRLDPFVRIEPVKLYPQLKGAIVPIVVGSTTDKDGS